MGGAEQMIPVNKRALYDCLRGESLAYTILSTGLQVAYNDLKPPIDDLSYLRPVIAVLYLAIAARFLMAGADRRKPLVFGIALLAASLATSANVLSLNAFFNWNARHSDCPTQVASGKLGFDLVADSALKKLAKELDASGLEASRKDNVPWNMSVRAEGRTLIHEYRLKGPFDVALFNGVINEEQKTALEAYCSDDVSILKNAKMTETHTYYSLQGERLTSFAIGPADCPKW